METAHFHLHSRMEERHWWFLASRRIVSRLVRSLLPPGRKKRIVDFGCGTGGNLAVFSSDYSCVGLDPSAEAIGQARARFPQMDFIQGISPELSRPACSSADLVLLMDVLEHVSDDGRLLSEIVQPMKPGALLLMTVPADASLWSPHDVSFGHFRRYNRSGLEQTWRGLPVRPLLLSYYNATLYPAVRAARFASRLRGRSSGEAGTDFRLPWAPMNFLLERVFSAEAGPLLRLLQGKQRNGFRRGVSLIAVLKREEAPLCGTLPDKSFEEVA